MKKQKVTQITEHDSCQRNCCASPDPKPLPTSSDTAADFEQNVCTDCSNAAEQPSNNRKPNKPTDQNVK